MGCLLLFLLTLRYFRFINVATVDFEVIDTPLRQGLRILLQVPLQARIAGAGVGPYVLVDAKLEAQIVHLKKIVRTFNRTKS